MSATTEGEREYLMEFLDRRDMIRNASLISLVTCTEPNIVVLKDMRKNDRYVEVQIKNIHRLVPPYMICVVYDN